VKKTPRGGSSREEFRDTWWSEEGKRFSKIEEMKVAENENDFKSTLFFSIF